MMQRPSTPDEQVLALLEQIYEEKMSPFPATRGFMFEDGKWSQFERGYSKTGDCDTCKGYVDLRLAPHLGVIWLCKPCAVRVGLDW